MLYLKLLATVLSLVLWCGGSANKVVPERVNVLKCCRIGETLQGGREPGDERCEPGGSINWAPLVYAPRRKGYLPQGTSPPYWAVLEAQHPRCPANLRPTVVRSSAVQKIIMFANGSMYYEKTILPPESFCIDSIAALVCPIVEETPNNEVSSLTQPKIKVNKCCDRGGAYSEKKGACVIAPEGPELTEQDVRLDGEERENAVELGAGFPVCSGDSGGLVIAGPLSEAGLTNDGSLQMTTAGVLLEKSHFCLERVVEVESFSVFACSESVPGRDDNGLYGSDSGPDRSDLRFTLYPVGLLISTAFLLATLLTGYLLPSSHHALHWRCQTNYIFCLLVGDLILATTQLAGAKIMGTACITMATLMHFFFLAAFFWLNTMCFNIWWTFRDFRPTSLEKRQEVCRLRLYELFAWGGPLLIAGVAAALDRLPPDPQRPFLRPRFGVRNCWFYGDMEILVFFFGPIGVLLGVNLVLFASTARQLTCGLWKREDVKSTTERAALGRVCMKLVVVMGITWVADVISWAVGGPNYVWYITDLINALQGVLIFIVVGCQPQVWAAVKKVWCLKKLRSNATNTTGAPMHSSSQGLPSIGDSVTNNTIANTNNSVKIPMETVC